MTPTLWPILPPPPTPTHDQQPPLVRFRDGHRRPRPSPRPPRLACTDSNAAQREAKGRLIPSPSGGPGERWGAMGSTRWRGPMRGITPTSTWGRGGGRIYEGTPWSCVKRCCGFMKEPLAWWRAREGKRRRFWKLLQCYSDARFAFHVSEVFVSVPALCHKGYSWTRGCSKRDECYAATWKKRAVVCAKCCV